MSLICNTFINRLHLSWCASSASGQSIRRPSTFSRSREASIRRVHEQNKKQKNAASKRTCSLTNKTPSVWHTCPTWTRRLPTGRGFEFEPSAPTTSTAQHFDGISWRIYAKNGTKGEAERKWGQKRLYFAILAVVDEHPPLWPGAARAFHCNFLSFFFLLSCFVLASLCRHVQPLIIIIVVFIKKEKKKKKKVKKLSEKRAAWFSFLFHVYQTCWCCSGVLIGRPCFAFYCLFLVSGPWHVFFSFSGSRYLMNTISVATDHSIAIYCRLKWPLLKMDIWVGCLQ